MRKLLNTVLAVCALAVIIGTDAVGNPVSAWGYRYGGYHTRSYYPDYYGRHSYRYYGAPSYYYSYGYYPQYYRHSYGSRHHWWHRHRHW
jgi:hypothetical protein